MTKLIHCWSLRLSVVCIITPAMKTLVGISLLLPFVSASILYPSTSQQVLHVNDQTSEGFIDRLLAIHDDDPVKVVCIVDADNAAELDEPQLLQVFGKEAV
ncbi:hypothetical protein PAXINDRAFT_19540 [Paxillus involutus ATCC 200175]|uniref:Uncharacterized protein n=1 Tax=Paxillus involutus ATCC 200175 TaxID=664439 RepID=A0A0C9SWP3_PAXIN|nr:hypothetical protein PAXINDRAFT_19540 [Paxillus involutus ATCC 200175]